MNGHALQRALRAGEWLGVSPSLSLVCVLRGFIIVGDEGNQRATSWGACCPEIAPLPRRGRLIVCAILHAAPRKQKNGTTVAKRGRPFSDHHPCVQGSRGPVVGSAFWTPFFRGRSEGERECRLRPSRFQRQTFTGFEEAAAHIPAARPMRNPFTPASQCSGVCAWSSGGRVCRDTGCHVLSPECGVARGQAFLHALVADPSKQLPLPAKGSGCLQGLDTKSGGGLQWIFPPSSDAFFFPFVYSLGHARLHVHCRGRLRKEKARTASEASCCCKCKKLNATLLQNASCMVSRLHA